MAKKIKDYYDVECAKLIADKIKSVYTDFDTIGFVDYLEKNLSDKEMLERQDIFVKAFERYMPYDYKGNISIFEKILGVELDTTVGMYKSGWRLWPIGRYVEKYGDTDLDTTLKFLYQLTKRFTGEFAIRPILSRYPKQTLETMLSWTKDKNVYIRRLAAEWARISLPRAKKMMTAIEYFDLYSKILDSLKDDDIKFVQKSVWNNLNDLMKVDPEKAYKIISSREKNNPTKNTLWIIKHGLRSLRK